MASKQRRARRAGEPRRGGAWERPRLSSETDRRDRGAPSPRHRSTAPESRRRSSVGPRPRPCPAARRHAPILRARQLRPARGDRERHTTARPARGGLGARQKGPTCARQKGPTEKSLEAEVSTGVGARQCRLERSPRGAHLGLSKRRLATFPAEFRLRRRYLAIPPGRRPQGCGQGASWSRGDARRWPPGWVPFGEQRRVLSRERPARAGAARIGR